MNRPATETEINVAIELRQAGIVPIKGAKAWEIYYVEGSPVDCDVIYNGQHNEHVVLNMRLEDTVNRLRNELETALRARGTLGEEINPDDYTHTVIDTWYCKALTQTGFVIEVPGETEAVAIGLALLVTLEQALFMPKAPAGKRLLFKGELAASAIPELSIAQPEDAAESLPDAEEGIHTEGYKADQGKPPLEALPWDALEQVAKVLAFGQNKYPDHPDGCPNWYLGMAWSRLAASCFRHVTAWLRGEDCDDESGLPHLAHAITCLLFLLTYTIQGRGTDDRWQNKPRPE